MKTLKTKETMTVSCNVNEIIEDMEVNSHLDGEFVELVVPIEWVEKMVKSNDWESLEDFQDEYVHDDTDGWISKAIEDGVILGLHMGIVNN